MGGNLSIGTNSPGKRIKFHTGGSTSTHVDMVVMDGRVEITGSLFVSQGFTGSVLGTCSYVIPMNTFSRGGSFVDWGGLGGSAAGSNYLPVWRAPFNCTANVIYATHRSSTAGVATATINARKNFTSLMLTASAPSNSGSWASYTSLQNNTFVMGDTLEILLISSSNYPEVVSIQVDFIRG